MKSTQDQVEWLKKAANLLNVELLSIEVFTDKSFRIAKHNGGETSQIIYDSDALEDTTQIHYDINDIFYIDPEIFVRDLIQRQDEAIDAGG